MMQCEVNRAATAGHATELCFLGLALADSNAHSLIFHLSSLISHLDGMMGLA